MALGFLFIITSIIGILIISTISIVFLKKDNIFKKNWFIFYILVLITVLTVITFTALPSNYIIYKIISVSLGLLGTLGVYMGKFKKLDFKINIVLITISLFGNFCIELLM